MKFGHQVTFNAHPDFVGKNIDYNKLKRLIYDIERVEAGEYHAHDPVYLRNSIDGGRDGGRPSAIVADDGADSPGRPLLGRSVSVSLNNPHVAKAQQAFQSAFQAELVRVGTFYQQELQKLTRDIEALAQQQQQAPEPSTPTSTRAAQENARIQQAGVLYHAVQNLLEFRAMNRDGFRKTLKKHDKVTQVSLTSTLMPEVDSRLPVDQDHRLQALGSRVLDIHSALSRCSREQSEAALQNEGQRTQLDFHRPTVWRDMVVLERSSRGPEVEVVDGRGSRSAAAKKSNERIRSVVICILAVAIFIGLLCADVFNGERSKNRCLAMLVLLSMLWASEAIPLYVTSMLVPALTVILKILPKDDGSPMGAPEAADRVFEVMFSPVIMLLLGGFAIAGALSKHYIAKAAATSIMARVRKPSNVVLASMFIATFFSMWISNVAAPVLCFALVQPILRRELSNRKLCKCIVMGIAMASNVGGMTSPISSPQNIFAIAYMAKLGTHTNWLEWFAIALPVSCACNLGIWMLLRIKYKPDHSVSEILPLRSSKAPITGAQVTVVVVSLITVALWCINTALQDVVGDQGIVAIIPLAVFFGTGILTKDDFNSFLWNIVMLAQGGLVLSEAVDKSGILSVAANFLEAQTKSFSVWVVLAVFCFAVVVCTTFISHTVGAMVILPVVQSVGIAMLPVPHPRMLVMANVLMCSGAMGLPVSGFPNMTASYLEDSMGQVYADVSDFLTIGISSSVISWAVIVTLGYSIMYSMGW